MSVVSRLELQARRRWAAENILNSEALTGDLADPEADRLLAWALERAEILVCDTAGMPPVEAQAVLEERLTSLRKLVRGINKLAGAHQPIEPERVQGRVARLAEPAAALDLACPDEAAIEAYASEHGRLDAGGRLAWLLCLFGRPADPAPPAPAAEEPS